LAKNGHFAGHVWGFECAGESEQADAEWYSETTQQWDFSRPLKKINNSQSGSISVKTVH
jgi:hypothetical protein